MEYRFVGPTAGPEGWENATAPVNENGLAGLLGDSLVAQDGSFAGVTALSMGFGIVSQQATGGSLIAAQIAKVKTISLAGARSIFLLVGTNDITGGRTPAQIYADYLALFSECARLRMQVYVSQLGPRDAGWSPYTYKAMVALYYASKQYPNVILADPWDDYAVSTGNWSVATMANDNTGNDQIHPVTSVHAAAATALVTAFNGRLRGKYPLPRVNGDTLLGHEMMPGAGGTPTGWTLTTAGASFSATCEAADALGRRRFIAALTAPALGDKCLIQKVLPISGFTDGDKLELVADIEAIWPDTDRQRVRTLLSIDHIDAGGTAYAYYSSTDGGVRFISGRCIHKASVTVSKNISGQVPASIRVSVGLSVFPGQTGTDATTYTAKIGRVGLNNLTALGLA